MTDAEHTQDDADLHWFGAIVQLPERSPRPKVTIRASVDSTQARADLARVAAETRSA